MPSNKDGKRLSGGAQRTKAAANKKRRAQLARIAPAIAAELPEMRRLLDAPEPRPIKTPPPPPPPNVDELLRWVSDVQATAATYAERGQDAPRVRAVMALVKAICKMRTAARDSARLVLALRKYRGEILDLTTVDPPAQRYARAAWAAWRLAGVLTTIAGQAESPDDQAVGHIAKAYSLLADAQDQAAIDALVAELVDEGEDST